MNPTICPAILASDPHEFRAQMESASRFAVRLHIDVADGQFAPVKTVPVDQIWWPGGVRADLHVMYKRPFDHLRAMLALQPQMIIVHAEAEGDFEMFAHRAHERGIQTGVALLPNTSPELLSQAIKDVDHVLIFSGNLGRYGGKADLELLKKVKALKELKPQLEIGWDGGVNDTNAMALVEGGIEVLNTGGFIQHADDPHTAYMHLRHVVGFQD
jgi:ribulose-phosphate 3-epimerase